MNKLWNKLVAVKSSICYGACQKGNWSFPILPNPATYLFFGVCVFAMCVILSWTLWYSGHWSILCILWILLVERSNKIKQDQTRLNGKPYRQAWEDICRTCSNFCFNWPASGWRQTKLHGASTALPNKYESTGASHSTNHLSRITTSGAKE